MHYSGRHQNIVPPINIVLCNSDSCTCRSLSVILWNLPLRPFSDPWTIKHVPLFRYYLINGIYSPNIINNTWTQKHCVAVLNDTNLILSYLSRIWISIPFVCAHDNFTRFHANSRENVLTRLAIIQLAETKEDGAPLKVEMRADKRGRALIAFPRCSRAARLFSDKPRISVRLWSAAISRPDPMKCKLSLATTSIARANVHVRIYIYIYR